MRTSVIAALALSLLLPAAASATPAAEARFFFERGQRHYERGRYGAAAEDFLLSYESAPSSGAIYNAAVASARARRPADEFSFLQVYLRLDDHDRERRQTARARIAELEATLAIVRVETSPPGATIYVDRDALGSFGTSPRDVVVGAGAHTVHLRLDGHVSQVVEVEAAEGERVDARAELPQHVGQIRLLGSPAGAAVRVLSNGDEVGETTIGATVELPVGTYILRVAEPGYAATEVRALVRADAEERRTLHARPTPPAVGQVLVSTTAGITARVSVDGHPRGETPGRLQDLRVGEHLVELVAPGWRPWRGNVLVRADRTSFVSVDLVATE